MKTLKFMPELCEMILKGTKTSTWRPFDDKDIQTGETIHFINKHNGEKFGEGKITEVKITTFGKLTDEDWVGHEGYSSEVEMYSTYAGYFPDKTINQNTELKIVRFDFLLK